MLIANPIYDVVFKYLMEDAKIAKIVLSSIIGQAIEKISFLPQEFISDIDKEKISKTRKSSTTRRENKNGLTVYRLDFSAQIKTAEGLKQVIIELQKAKFPTDIIRFRQYLGQQFADKKTSSLKKLISAFARWAFPSLAFIFWAIS